MNNVTQWTVPVNHPSFTGHFPGNPTLPGVVLLDVALHTIAKAIGRSSDVCEIKSVKFLSPALPNDQLVIEHRQLESGIIHFDIVCGPRRIATGRIMINSPESTPTV